MSAMEENSRAGNILRLPQVRLRTGLSKSTIYELESKGAFPPTYRACRRLGRGGDSRVERNAAENKA